MTEKPTVLLVEDDPATARLVEAQFEGLEDAPILEHAPGLDEARRLLSEGDQDHDVVVTDLGLPGTRGVETVEALAEATNLPILAWTGLVDGKVREEARRAGALDVLDKGENDGASLAQAVHGALGGDPPD